MHEWYPDAKFILTVRDSNKWFQSLSNMIVKHETLDGSLSEFHKDGRYGDAYFFEKIYNIKDIRNDKEKITKHYESTNKAIEEYFGKSPNFIKIDFTLKDGVENWVTLSNFLDKSIPDRPFQHSNPTSAKKGGMKSKKLTRNEKIVIILRRVGNKLQKVRTTFMKI